MDRNSFRNAAILHECDDDVDLLYHCIFFVSLFSVSGFPNLKEHISRNTLHISVVATKFSVYVIYTLIFIDGL